jgi:uncharacterized membrane protein YtjA (UPF0391 family)
MLSWSLLFFILAIIAGVFGFGGISAGFAELGQLLFFFLVIFAVSLVWGLVTGRRPPPPPI